MSNAESNDKKMLSANECAALVAKEYPSFYVSGFFEYQDHYYFTIVPKGQSPWKALTDLHKVDRINGYVSGAIQITTFLKQPGAVEAIKKTQPMGRGSMLRKIYYRFLQKNAIWKNTDL